MHQRNLYHSINIIYGVFCCESFINFRVIYLIFQQTDIIEYKTSHDYLVHKNYQTSINVSSVPHKFFALTQCLHQGPSAIRQCTSAKLIWHRNLNHFSWTYKPNIIMINTEMVSSNIIAQRNRTSFCGEISSGGHLLMSRKCSIFLHERSTFTENFKFGTRKTETFGNWICLMKNKLSNIFLKVYIIGYQYISVSWLCGTPISSYYRIIFMWPVGSHNDGSSLWLPLSL
jgi:hypothetical protein